MWRNTGKLLYLTKCYQLDKVLVMANPAEGDFFYVRPLLCSQKHLFKNMHYISISNMGKVNINYSMFSGSDYEVK